MNISTLVGQIFFLCVLPPFYFSSKDGAYLARACRVRGAAPHSGVSSFGFLSTVSSPAPSPRPLSGTQ
jgi:hypothetical protein